MQARWLIDGDGPSPDFANDNLTVRIPAGTIVGTEAAIGDANCWHLCFPDNSGDPRRGVPGLIYCEPADDECRAKVAAEYRALSPEKRRWFDLARKRTDVVRKEQLAKAAQDARDGIPPMPLHPALVEAENDPQPVVIEG